MGGTRVGREKAITVRGRRFRLKVETSSNAADYAKYDDLRETVWGFPEDHLAGTRNMMCESYLHEGSSLFIGAYAEAAGGGFGEGVSPLAGFAYGFVGVKDKGVAFKALDNLWFYAQYTAVSPEYQGFGLGTAIKEFQGEVVRDDLGVFEVVCTYDPLTGVNAYRNIHHFGMRVLDYRVATYGEYGGLLNRLDVPTDRFFMSWDLRGGEKRPALNLDDVRRDGKEVLMVETVAVAGKTRTVEVERVRGVDLGGDSPFWIVRIPADFYVLLRETDVPDSEVRRIPLDWRMATREAFQGLFGRGFRVVDFVKVLGLRSLNAYLLRRT
jgi:predicted GNAT superfamily acetyltransferase